MASTKQRDRSRVTDPVLLAAADATRIEQAAAARKFALAAQWAEAHPAPVEDDVVDQTGALVMYGDQPITIAGEGAPGMAEFAIAEFAAAINVSTWSARNLIGAAIECKHRLPAIWRRVMAGEIPVWKARRVTDHTHRLPLMAAAVVDRELAPIMATCSFAQIERAVEAVTAQVDDERVEELRHDQWHHQHLDLHLQDAHLNHGFVPVNGLLDYADALALEKTLQAKAHQLLAEFPDLDLDVRRAMAAGRLGSDSTEPTAEVVVYAHLDPTAAHRMIDVEKLGTTSIEQLHDWCRYNTTKVTIRPVIELDREITIDRYEPTPEQREQAILTNPTCVHPDCSTPARGCDLDHVIPYTDGGETTSWNLAPLCRPHHRLKTHGGWQYVRLTRTSFVWTSPEHQVIYVDNTTKRRRTR